MTDAAAQVQKLLRQQAAIARFGNLALRERDLTKILSEAARACAEGLDVPFSKVWRYRAEENDLLVVAGHGWQDGVIGHVVSRADMRFAAGTRLHHRARRPSSTICRRTQASIRRRFMPRTASSRSSMSSSRAATTSHIGVLEIDNDQRHDYDQHDVDFLAAFASLLAEAISTASRGAAAAGYRREDEGAGRGEGPPARTKGPPRICSFARPTRWKRSVN